MYVCLGAIAIGGGLGMRAMQRWLSEDWREVATCRATYWTCESTIQGLPRLIVRTGSKPTFKSEAKACDEYTAFETAMRRATFDCSTGSNVIGGSCRELETECWLPTEATGG